MLRGSTAYLLVQYFSSDVLRWTPPPADGSGAMGEAATLSHLPIFFWPCAARDVEMEVERYRAKAKGGSLMPLTYALVALAQIDREVPPDPIKAASAVAAALDTVDAELGQNGLSSGTGLIVRRLMNDIRQHRPTPVPSSLVNTRKSPNRGTY
jgi:hypothetical protein